MHLVLFSDRMADLELSLELLPVLVLTGTGQDRTVRLCTSLEVSKQALLAFCKPQSTALEAITDGVSL